MLLAEGLDQLGVGGLVDRLGENGQLGGATLDGAGGLCSKRQGDDCVFGHQRSGTAGDSLCTQLPDSPCRPRERPSWAMAFLRTRRRPVITSMGSPGAGAWACWVVSTSLRDRNGGCIEIMADEKMCGWRRHGASRGRRLLGAVGCAPKKAGSHGLRARSTGKDFYTMCPVDLTRQTFFVLSPRGRPEKKGTRGNGVCKRTAVLGACLAQ